MASFTPSTSSISSSFAGQSSAQVVIDSTYNGLGGTYDSIGYGYDGALVLFGGQTQTTSAFVAGSAPLPTTFPTNSTVTGSFTPNGS